MANAHAADRRMDGGEGAVAIVEEKPWSLVVGKRLARLLGGPRGGRALEHLELMVQARISTSKAALVRNDVPRV